MFFIVLAIRPNQAFSTLNPFGGDMRPIIKNHTVTIVKLTAMIARAMNMSKIVSLVVIIFI